MNDKYISYCLPSVAIVKPVGDWCNLRCDYCFHHMKDQVQKRLMDIEFLERFLKEYFALPLEEYGFSWHGGEPLLAGIPFFKEVVRLQRKLGKDAKINNAIQTNGILIDDEWAAFFKHNDFGVGISLDGCREAHNRFRVDYNRKGSFDRVIKAIETLRAWKIEPGILQTFTRSNIAYTEKNFLFLIEKLGVKSIGINPFYDLEGINTDMVGQTLSPEEFTTALKTYVRLWLRKKHSCLKIREICDFLAGTLGKIASTPCFYGLCEVVFCIEWNGEVYPCDQVPGKEEFLCGNLVHQSLEEILNGPAWRKYIERISILTETCRTCSWLVACNNGCPFLREGGVEGIYYYCKSRQEMFAYFDRLIKEYCLNT